MPIFRVPVKERYILVGKASFNSQSQVIIVDGCGAVVYSNQPVEIKSKLLKQSIAGERNDVYHVEAENPEELFLGFAKDVPESSLGERPAVRINEVGTIVQFPKCEFLHRNLGGDYICGELEDPNNGFGEYGMCFLSGCKPPDNCKPWLFLANLEDLVNLGLARVEEIKGYKFIRPN